MNLSTLRGMSPGSSLLDLLEMQEQGLGGERGREFLKETVGQYNKMFGDEDLTVLALRSRFPGIPISDLKRLARGEDVLGSMETSKMTKGVDLQGQGNVSTRAIMQAEVTDAFSVGAVEGMRAVNKQMAEILKLAFEEAIKDIDLTKIAAKDKPTEERIKGNVYNFGARGLTF
jgi:hypothetical protein